MTHIFIRTVLWSSSLLAACQSTKPHGDNATNELWRELTQTRELVFPPPLTDRRPSSAMPARYSRVRELAAAHVMHPQLDDVGAFELEGQTLRLDFDRPMVQTRHGKPTSSPPRDLLAVTPPVAGKLRWEDQDTLVFVAAAPFDPVVTYEARLANAHALDGLATEAWSGKFTAKPCIELAGKILDYLPTPGQPKVVVVEPPAGARLGRARTPAVLFDQPVEPSDVHDLIELKDADGKPVSFTLKHPKHDRFDGLRVDRRLVVELMMAQTRQPGATFELTARDRIADNQDPKRSDFSIAEPLTLETVGCEPANESGECARKDGVVHVQGRELLVTFNNPLLGNDETLLRSIHVTPQPPNLAVWNSGEWDGTGNMVISGGFMPSSRYQVSVAGIRDVYGGRVREPITFEFETMPLPASVSAPEGTFVLDDANTRAFRVTTQNVAVVRLRAWPLGNDPAAWQAARAKQQVGQVLTLPAPVSVSIPVRAQRDTLVDTTIDLRHTLGTGQGYLVAFNADTPAFGAQPVMAGKAGDGRDHVVLLVPGDAQAVSAHARMLDDATIVDVARALDGSPIAGADISVDVLPDNRATTDVDGVAVLPVRRDRVEHSVLRIVVDGRTTNVPLGDHAIHAGEISPELARGDESPSALVRGMLLTDRGIYRPDTAIQVKGIVRADQAGELIPIGLLPIRIRLLGPTGEVVDQAFGVTDEYGAVVAKLDVPAHARLGRHNLMLDAPLGEHGALASLVLQVAKFEPPRFLVDVEARTRANGHVAASVSGRYGFGAAMQGASVSWAMYQLPAHMPDGTLVRAGLRFRAQYPSSWDEPQRHVRSGEGVLDRDGKFDIVLSPSLADASGPQQLEIEADVVDASQRHVANRAITIVHPAAHYVGLHVTDGWVAPNERVRVGLGAIDNNGRAVKGLAVSAVLEKIEWRYTSMRGPGGSTDTDWHAIRIPSGHCDVVTEQAVVSCEVTPNEEGSYEIVATLDGVRGGSWPIWVWRPTGGARITVPTRGRTLELSSDKPHYIPGETAKILVKNPFAKARALVTIEQGSLLSHQSMTLDGNATVVEIPVQARHTPWVHVGVTLFPLDASGSERFDWKLGAVRIAVDDAPMRLGLKLASDKPTYAPGESATIDVVVERSDGAPQSHADVALYVVDEAVLRLTNHHAPDPVRSLRPGQPLRFIAQDTRTALGKLWMVNRASGDGAGHGTASLTDARKRFVQTALWEPRLRTDANGHARVTFTLPDNLTRFRVMAVVLDRVGRGAAAEHAFEVRKDVMLVPVLPRFASFGDTLELPVMVHNAVGKPVEVRVRLGNEVKAVDVPAGGRTRVAFWSTANYYGKRSLTFTLEDSRGTVLDRVQTWLEVQSSGVATRPHLEGAFVGTQDILLAVPAGVQGLAGPDDVLLVRAGQHLWPELTSGLEFLVDYPHGCVEQTTSGVLPLLALREVLPRLGFTRFSDVELRERIRAGLERLAAMRTDTGGLSYWPGVNEPDLYGTAYAMRAVVLASKAGLAMPEGLSDEMSRFLHERLLASDIEPEIQAAIAQSLAELGKLRASVADALFDRKDKQGLFGIASLAIALGEIEGHSARVEALLDTLEAAIDPTGELLVAQKPSEHAYFGSPTRTRAQVTIALARLRPRSTLVPVLSRALVRTREHHTTQATAYLLLALSEQLHEDTSSAPFPIITLDGVSQEPTRVLELGGVELGIPLAELSGIQRTLRIEASGDAPVTFQLSAGWRANADDDSLASSSSTTGPDVYRVLTDAKGGPAPLDRISVGQLLRVSLLVRMPNAIDPERSRFLALTDRLPAGFEPVSTDLWTVARVPDLAAVHPLYALLNDSGNHANHLEMHDNRVDVYFDRVWGKEVAASYLVRASTAGTFAFPPPSAELMYEGGSIAYGARQQVTIR